MSQTTTWQPIETAPFNEYIICWFPSWEIAGVCRKVPADDGLHRWEVSESISQCFILVDYYLSEENEKPTLWMDLPCGPTT